MVKKVLLMTAVLAATGIAPALGADLAARPYTKAPFVAPVMSWTGCYIGGNVGGGWTKTHQEFAPPFAGVFSDNKGSAVIGGAQVGCDYQFNRFVIGVQGQFDFGQIKSTVVEPLFPTFTAGVQTNQIFTATARVGYLIDPSVLAYLKGGAAWAQTDLKVIGSVPSTFLSESAKSNRTGWTIGGGAEWMFAPGWSVFAEYNYMDFGTKLTQYVAGPNTVGAPNVLNVSTTAQTALVGINYKFSWGGLAKY